MDIQRSGDVLVIPGGTGLEQLEAVREDFIAEKYKRGWCFPSELEVGDQYCPSGYDTNDPTAWLTVDDVFERLDEVIVNHVEDDHEGDAASFDTSAIVFVRPSKSEDQED